MIARRELWAAGGLFTILTLGFTYPLSTRAASVMLEDQPDSHLFIWTFGWIAHALATDPLSLFDANIFHPLTHTLAFSENLLGSGLIAAPLIWLTGNHVLATNVVSLSSVVLCGVGAYFLGRTLGMRPAAAFICGIVYAFCPPRFFRIGQLHLTTVQWIPFALAYLHAYFAQGHGRWLKLAALFFTLQALATGHGAVFLAVSMAALIAYRLAVGDPPAPVRRLRDLGLTGALLLAPAILIAIPYRLVQREMGLIRTLDDWAVPAVSFLASPSPFHQWVLAHFTSVARVNEAAHAFLFPGYLPPLFAVLAIVLAGRRMVTDRATDPTLFYALLLLLTILLSVGPPLGIWPLVHGLPGFNLIRVPSRFTILGVLALAVLSGLAVERLMRRPSGRLKGLRYVAHLSAVLMLAEFSVIPLKVTPFTTRPPAAERWLADQSKPFVVAELPQFGVMRDHSIYMLHSMAHWQKTVHGFSGFDPPAHMELYARMRRFPSNDSLEAMRGFGVTHLILHLDRYDPGQWEALAAAVEQAPGLELVFQEARSRVYRLR
jgi:hypothetical protein